MVCGSDALDSVHLFCSWLCLFLCGKTIIFIVHDRLICEMNSLGSVEAEDKLKI